MYKMAVFEVQVGMYLHLDLLFMGHITPVSSFTGPFHYANNRQFLLSVQNNLTDLISCGLNLLIHFALPTDLVVVAFKSLKEVGSLPTSTVIPNI